MNPQKRGAKEGPVFGPAQAEIGFSSIGEHCARISVVIFPDSPPLCGVRLVTARLVGASPDIFPEAAGSAIKGIALVPPQQTTQPTATTSSAMTAAASRDGSGAMPRSTSARENSDRIDHHTPKLVTTMFTVSRDQRLSRWEVFENHHGHDKYVCSTRDSTSGRRGARGDSDHRESEADSERVAIDANKEIHVRGAEPEDVGNETAESVGGSRGKSRNRRERRWQLEWRAGCVTDVCDVSSLSVVELPAHDVQAVPLAESGDGACTSQTSMGYPTSGVSERSLGASSVVSHRTRGGAAPVTANLSSDEQPGGDATRDVPRQSVLAAVAGQGIQLVVFGGGAR